MKSFNHQFNHNRGLFIVCVLVIISSITAATTWYVDPVDGSDFYDGTSPFFIEGTMIGPKQTIGDSAMAAGQYDILVLLDGVYSGQDNTGSHVFSDIDFKHLTVTGLSGPDNCILQLGTLNSIFFNLYVPEGDLATVFRGLTFTSIQLFPHDPVFSFYNASAVTFDNCIFTQFKQYQGDSMIRIENSSVEFIDCQFTHNEAAQIIGCRSSMGELSTLTCRNCTFEYNVPGDNGFSDSPFSPIHLSHLAYGMIDNCTIRNHVINQRSFAGIAVIGNAQADVQRCVIENNTSSLNHDGYAAGVLCEEAALSISDTRIENITAISNYEYVTGIAIAASRPTRLMVQHCTLKNNGNGINLAHTTLTEPHSVFIHSTEISGYYNETQPGMGSTGIYLGEGVQNYETEIFNCNIHTHNTAIHASMAPHFQLFLVENCLIHNNLMDGINIHNDQEASPLVFKNCTIVQNSQFGLVTSNAVVSNCIIRQNGHAGIYSHGGVDVNYCNIQDGWTQLGGVGNIDVDPLFADGGQFGPGYHDYIAGTDFHLKSTAGRYIEGQPWGTWVQDEVDSPCIDAGDPADPVLDEPYGSGGRINMGVYGRTWQASKTDLCFGGINHTGQIYGDINHDCTVNLADIAIIAENWLQSTKVAEPF